MAVGLGLSAGAGLAVQSRLNGELGARLGDGVAASLASTLVGLALLVGSVPVVPAGRRALCRVGSTLRTGRLRWWQCSGGLGGALFVASQGISVGELGVAVFTVAVVGGTAVGALVADRFGLGPGGRRPMSAARVGGALACVAAVALAGHDRLGGPAALILVVPVLAGAAVAAQSALNGRVGAAAGSPWAATLISFSLAALALSVALLVDPGPGLFDRLPGQPWVYGGGVVGIGVIAMGTVVVRRVGVLVFGLASVAGQVLGAVVLDWVTPGPRPTVVTVIAVLVTLGAAVLAARN
jgi:transporter family-2 protein